MEALFLLSFYAFSDSFSQAVSLDLDFGDEYLDYVSGVNLSNRMPFSIPVRSLVSRSDLMNFLRGQFEGTQFDMTVDVGAGPYAVPYRARPLTWQVRGWESIQRM